MSIEKILEELIESGQFDTLLTDARSSLQDIMNNEAIINQLKQIALSSEEENFAQQIAGMNHNSADHFNKMFYIMSRWMFMSVMHCHKQLMEAEMDVTDEGIDIPVNTEDEGGEEWMHGGGVGLVDDEPLGPSLEHDVDAPSVEELRDLIDD